MGNVDRKQYSLKVNSLECNTLSLSTTNDRLDKSPPALNQTEMVNAIVSSVTNNMQNHLQNVQQQTQSTQNGQKQNPNNQKKNKGQQRAKSPTPQREPQCYFCLQKGHIQRDCEVRAKLIATLPGSSGVAGQNSPTVAKSPTPATQLPEN